MSITRAALRTWQSRRGRKPYRLRRTRLRQTAFGPRWVPTVRSDPYSGALPQSWWICHQSTLYSRSIGGSPDLPKEGPRQLAAASIRFIVPQRNRAQPSLGPKTQGGVPVVRFDWLRSLLSERCWLFRTSTEWKRPLLAARSSDGWADC